MALDADALAESIKEKLKVGLTLSGTDEADMKAEIKKITEEFQSHYIALAVITTSTSSTGATAIGPPGGPLPITALPGTGSGGISA